MASVFGTTLETGGNGEIEKALRKIVKDEVRKEQLKYDLIVQERESEHQKQLLELENKLVKQSEYKQAQLELELKKQASKNEKVLLDQKALQELSQKKYSQHDVRPRTYNNGHHSGYQSGQVNLLKMPDTPTSRSGKYGSNDLESKIREIERKHNTIREKLEISGNRLAQTKSGEYHVVSSARPQRMEEIIQKMKDADVRGSTDLNQHQKSYMEKLNELLVNAKASAMFKQNPQYVQQQAIHPQQNPQAYNLPH